MPAKRAGVLHFEPLPQTFRVEVVTARHVHRFGPAHDHGLAADRAGLVGARLPLDDGDAETVNGRLARGLLWRLLLHGYSLDDRGHELLEAGLRAKARLGECFRALVQCTDVVDKPQ